MWKAAGFLLRKLDSAIVRTAGWKHIPNSDTGFMYMCPHKYKGATIILKDGTAVNKGDWIAELHLDNKGLKRLDTSYASLIRLYKGELKALKSCFSQGLYPDIKAVFGITVFHEIAVRQGYTVLDIRSPVKKFFVSLWENILRLAYHKKINKRGKKFVISKECWISRDQIMNS